MQSGVKLYLVDYGMAANEFFYQIGLTDFGNLGLVQLRPAPMLKEVLGIAADFEIANDPDSAGLNRDHVVEKVYTQLLSRKEMLKEYFSLQISDAGELETIPLMLKGYMPSLAKLPTFLLRLGPFVDWTDEQACFHSFLRELSSFHVPERLEKTANAETEDTQPDIEGSRRLEMERVLENVLFPALRSRIVATQGMVKGVVEVANLKGLYRVFERC